MSKVYHIAVLRQATDLESDGELRMQEAILSTVKELNQANNFRCTLRGAACKP